MKHTEVTVAALSTAGLWTLGVMVLVIASAWLTHVPERVRENPDSIMMAGLSAGDGVKMRIDSGASRHFISDVRLFASWDEDAPNITFSTAVGVPITSRAVGTLKFVTTDVNSNLRVVTLDQAYYVPNQPHNLISVSQLTKQSADTWESPNFSSCTRVNDTGVPFQFSYDNREFYWHVEPIPAEGVDTVDGIAADGAMAVTRSVSLAQRPSPARPTGHHKRGKRKPAATPQNSQTAPHPTAANFYSKHGITLGGLQVTQVQSHDDCQLVKSEFRALSTQHCPGGRVDVDLFTDAGPNRIGNSQCARYHSSEDDAFEYPWVGACFYGNPVASMRGGNGPV